MADPIPTPVGNQTPPAIPPTSTIPAPAPEQTPPAIPAEGTTPPEVDPKVKSLEDRNTALQESLDSALEEIADKNNPKPAEPVIPAVPAAPAAPAVPVEVPKPAVKPESVPTPVEPATPPAAMTKEEEDASWKKALDDKDQQWQERFNNLELRDTMVELTLETQKAIANFPHAREREILLAVEEGSDKSINDIAKDLHTNHEEFLKKERISIEEKVRGDILKEQKGGISIPQSTGTSSTPNVTDQPQGALPRKQADDTAWATATREAKAGLGT